MIIIPRIKLNPKTNLPILGFGTWKLSGKTCQKAVEKALQIGFRHIDTAARYKNHKAISRAIQNSQIKRKDLFITSKVWRTNLKKENLKIDLLKTLDDLHLEYLDLYLIHWPSRIIPLKETLSAMRQLKEKKLIKAFGVSNFTIPLLKEALKTKIKISVNQIEIHPSFSQAKIVEFCQKNKIALIAYSPLGQGQDLNLPVVKKIAKICL